MRAEQASSTAQVIAASTILLASDPRHASEIAPGAAALCGIFLSTSWRGRWLAKSAMCPLTRGLWRQVERLTLPGIISHYWHRKRWIEARCRSAIAEGFSRMVILGAGFDTLATRLAREFPEVDFIEMDHPATGNAKQRAIAGHPLQFPDQLRFVALDLSRDPIPSLWFGDGKPTLFIAEGLLMYLSEIEIDRLFSSLRSLPAARLRLVFSFMSQWPDGSSGFRPRSRLIEWWLRWRSEPFRWALHPSRMAAFLSNRGFDLMEMASTPDFSSTQMTGLDGENLVACQRSNIDTD